ncbi:aminotransferase class I/II-fold pyridoxal phosphate-dependent enzyme [Paenibacillus polymyxa]|uniref:aminotransferase class I/II-fold pyridoxal phosphate-dependent enzyme n=1 Tax=Paenibacillus TaxID=44249 RepID=UPI00077C1279|nr:aminotransferase class I/II-fold pyridoxal phosphate-dependent enzyme [Paenibacillus polymyxa]AOK90131.1 pyridoxal phosphate-dependent aminotransferase [Paenibacillus polymyxa]KYG94903.1 pyridoxal phosphate-dependent aminotransferase [Paenibacillus polymyxa]
MSNRDRIYLSSPHMGGFEQQYITEAFETNWIAPLGKNVDAFEAEVANYLGCGGAVALSSGTAAIHLSLILLGVEKDDIVFCSSLTFVASANPILYQGAIPVFIDSEPDSWNMSPEALERAFKTYADKGKKPKAVVIVNLYGQSADYDRLKKICDYYEVPIVEDAAESLGATYGKQMSGTLGKFGILSFNGNKIITTSGGGMLVSDDLEALSRARHYATQARDKAIYYQHSMLGYNYRLSNVLAGIGRGQLKVLEDRISQKRDIFGLYHKMLSELDGVYFMPEKGFGKSTRWLTAMQIDSTKVGIEAHELVHYLEKFNVESRPVWKPLHLQPLFNEADYFTHEVGRDISRELFLNGICLPSDTNMTRENQEFVIQLIKNAFNH